MKRQALETNKGKKGNRPSLPRLENQKKSKRRNWPGMPRGYQGLGILRACNIDRMRWRKFKRAPRNTRNEGQKCPSQQPNDAERNQKAWD